MTSGQTPTAYLFTDIHGSTERWERWPLEMKAAMVRHDCIVEDLVRRHGGELKNRMGDGVFAAFKAGSPLRCALEIQLALQAEDWGAVGGLFVRIGVHADTPGDGDEQISINRAARIMSSGWGGQIVVSEEAVEAFAPPPQCRLTDLGLCHLKGIDEPMRLFSLVHDRLVRTEFPPLQTLTFYTGKLPDQPTPFFGRERETAHIARMLGSPQTRLVVLVGPGGNGKTRLAVHLAAKYAQRFLAWFVPLDTAVSGADIVAAIARALHFPFYGPSAEADQLLHYLRDKEALLVLDNADAFVHDPALVLRLFEGCPKLRILVTSREPLHIARATHYQVAGFATPNRDEVRTSAAYQLFCHQAGGDDTCLEDDDLECFRELCVTLDGSPLALLLAAQWRSLLSPKEILAKVKAGLDFLGAIAPDLPERHRSLRGVFEATWALLSGDEQRDLARLSIFSGGFTLQAAEAVARLDLRVLSALKDMGLVEQRQHDRFLMHPLIHEYAREKLAAMSDVERETGQRHSEYYLSMVDAEFAAIASVGESLVLDRIECEIANLKAAWRHAIREGARKRLRQAAEALFYALLLRARYSDALEFFYVKTGARRLDKYFSSLLATCQVQHGALDAAEAAALATLRDEDQSLTARAHAHHGLALVAHGRGDFAAAKRNYELALAIRRQRSDWIGCYYSASSLALVHVLLGELNEARERIKESYRLCELLGNTSGMMYVHLLAGDLAAREGRAEDAKANYYKSLDIEEAIHNPQYRARILISLGSLLAKQGDSSGAQRCHSEAVDLAAEVGDRLRRANALLELATDLRIDGKAEQAKARLLDATPVALMLSARPLLLRCLLELARVEMLCGNEAGARRLAAALASVELGSLGDAYREFLDELSCPPFAANDQCTPEAAAREIVEQAELETLRL